MTAANFEPSLARVLKSEGGKVDDPRDPGGRTAYGITQNVYNSYLKNKGEPSHDVFDISPEERDDIYRLQYWDAIKGDQLPSGVDYLVFDGAVNSGPSQSIKWLQRAVGGIAVDGYLGQATLAAIAASHSLQPIISAAADARRAFLQQLSTFSVYGNGWMKRVADVEAAAMAWATGNAPAQPPAAVGTAKAPVTAAKKAPSTGPGDITTAAAGAGIAATAAAGSHQVSVTPSTPSAAATPAAPATAPTTTAPTTTAPTTTAPATSAPAATAPTTSAPTATGPAAASSAPSAPSAPPAPSAPTSTGAPPAAPTTTTTTTTPAAQPHKPLVSIKDSDLIYVFIALGVVLVIGLYLSWSARRDRTKRANALGEAPSAPAGAASATLASTPPSGGAANLATAAAAVQSGPAGLAKLAGSWAAIALSYAWIAVTIGVNVVALAKLLGEFGYAPSHWNGFFAQFGALYDHYATAGFNYVAGYVSNQFHITLPQWLMPVFVIYVSMASAFVVAGTSLVQRESKAQAFFSSIVNSGWLLALPAFIMDAFRYRVVSKFAQQNTRLFFLYVVAFVGIYLGARYVNAHFADGPQTAQLTQEALLIEPMLAPIMLGAR